MECGEFEFVLLFTNITRRESGHLAARSIPKGFDLDQAWVKE
jgi:hypothetical protein